VHERLKKKGKYRLRIWQAGVEWCLALHVELTYPNPSLHLINFFGREGNINLT
jgi:hypothetical protein